MPPRIVIDLSYNSDNGSPALFGVFIAGFDTMTNGAAAWPVTFRETFTDNGHGRRIGRISIAEFAAFRKRDMQQLKVRRANIVVFRFMKFTGLNRLALNAEGIGIAAGKRHLHRDSRRLHARAAIQALGQAVEESRALLGRLVARVRQSYAEGKNGLKLARMHQQLSRVVALPAAATRNSGLELAGVVQATEDAANRIMGAAEKISAALNDVDPKPAVLEQVNAIFEACSFQDLTSQRIRRVLDQLTAVDNMLAQMAEHTQHPPEGEGTDQPREPIRLTFEMLGTGPDLAQSEIDRLMSG